jgi:hypothetical protein
MRLAPTVAFAHGMMVYPTATDGTVNTWMYGPLPVLFFWPASWARTAGDALMVAAILNVAITLVPLALVCFTWPVGNGQLASTMGRVTAFLLCMAIWPELHYSVLFSDNLAIACGLIANLILVRARSPRELWFAAITATAAVACKQICLGIPLAQVLWLGISTGRSAAIRHFVRCIVCGAIIATSAIAMFGLKALWFTLVDIPGSLGWAPDVTARFLMVAPQLGLHIVVPIVVIFLARRTFAAPALLLPSLAWICSLPLGVAALFKVGGWTNSIHGFLLWLPAVMTTFLAARRPVPRLGAAHLMIGLITAAILCVRVIREPDLPLKPRLAHYRAAERITMSLPDQLWFPLHPLITLYSDHRYYHDEDGMYVRRKANKGLTRGQAAGNLPPNMRGMAFLNNWNDWGIARSMLPPNSHQSTFGNWTVWSGVIEQSAP